MEDYLNNLLSYLKSFENKRVDELLACFNITSNSKAKNYILSKTLVDSFEGKGIGFAKIEKCGINIKTIQLKENGNPKEAMSFSPINYCKIVNEEWKNSAFKKYLSNYFIFFVYKKNNDINTLIKIIKWKVPDNDLNGEIKLVWEDTKKKISEGTVIKEEKNGKIITWFLSEKVTNICHVRPHGSNGSDVSKLPVTDKATGYEHALKHSFWFNHSYIKNIIDNS